MSEIHVSLSCEQCKKRKTKCDKIAPQCSACRLANIECRPVQRARLPRGRTGNAKRKSTTLTEKVSRLENLVSQLETQLQGSDTGDLTRSPPGLPDTSRLQGAASRVEGLIARDFWLALSNEVSGLRETLESAGSDINQSDDVFQRCQPKVHHTPLVFLFNQNTKLTSNSHSSLTQRVRMHLLQTYYDRVDILFKVTHWPSIITSLRDTNHSKDSSVPDIAPSLLEICICFMAACTLTNQECSQLQIGSRDIVIQQCRCAADYALSHTNFLVEPTFLTLQAFTIYLMALRCSGEGAMVWSLLALAIRLASALNLGSEHNNTLSALDIEQHRRLWFGIGLLDSQAAFGQGSIPLIPWRELKHPPLNINDSEVGVKTISDQPSTEMSVSCLTHQAMLCQRELCDVSAGTTWQERIGIVAKFEHFVNRTYSNLEFSVDPLERFTALGAKDMMVNMQLVLRRPLYRNRDSSLPDPPPPFDDFNVLDAAVSVLERGLTKQFSLEFAKWSWFSWPLWYALAIVLVELCSTKTSTNHKPSPVTTAERERAYAIAQQSFANYAQSASDISSGMLWQPIVKLMHRVRQLHGQEQDSPVDTDGASASHYGKPTIHHTELDERTILSRYHAALRVDNTEPDLTYGGEVDMDFQWDTFLNELYHSGGSTSASGSNTQSRSTWSLIPYPPFLPNRSGLG